MIWLRWEIFKISKRKIYNFFNSFQIYHPKKERNENWILKKTVFEYRISPFVVSPLACQLTLNYVTTLFQDPFMQCAIPLFFIVYECYSECAVFVGETMFAISNSQETVRLYFTWINQSHIDFWEYSDDSVDLTKCKSFKWELGTQHIWLA